MLSPTLVEGILRLGTWMPFGRVPGMCDYFTKVKVFEAGVRRTTEGGGQAYVEVQADQMEALEKDTPEVPAGPSVQQVSVDGAFVPLVRKEWAEVKTLAIGKVEAPVLEKGEWVVPIPKTSLTSPGLRTMRPLLAWLQWRLIGGGWRRRG